MGLPTQMFCRQGNIKQVFQPALSVAVYIGGVSGVTFIGSKEGLIKILLYAGSYRLLIYQSVKNISRGNQQETDPR